MTKVYLYRKIGTFLSLNLEISKWIWTDNNYTGFNVSDAWNWSKKWLSTLTETSDGNGIERWNAQLDRYGLPHDE